MWYVHVHITIIIYAHVLHLKTLSYNTIMHETGYINKYIVIRELFVSAVLLVCTDGEKCLTTFGLPWKLLLWVYATFLRTI